MTRVTAVPGSFRDPASTVCYVDDRVIRGLTAEGRAGFEALAATDCYRRLLDSGKLIGTRRIDLAELPEAARRSGWVAALEHERVPVVTYPYEWTFSMLKDAAALHLDVLADAMAEGLTTKDGYAYNLLFRGARPVFIDVGSFEPARAGEPWAGYRQFCQTMLYPLLLQAHRDVRFQPWLRGQVGGISPHDMRRLLHGRDLFRAGVLKHVVLHSSMDRRMSGARAASTRQELRAAGFSTEITTALVRALRKLVEGLRWKRSDSEWSRYRQTCGYDDAEAERKAAFVERALEGRGARLAYDLGANDGTYSRLAARHAGHVVAVDGDDVVLDTLYRQLRQEGNDRILPMVVDLADPSPGLGWRGRERDGFADRARADAVLALAVVHHLAITGNVPMSELVDWLHGFGGRLVVEFVHHDDPMADRLLANKPAGMHADYRQEVWEKLLAERFEIVDSEQLPSGRRTLYHAVPKPAANG